MLPRSGRHVKAACRCVAPLMLH